MTAPPPKPDDAPANPDEPARHWREKCLEKEAVIARIKAYIAPWKHDKRLKVMGEILLGEIERVEREEAEKTAKEGRRA